MGKTPGKAKAPAPVIKDEPGAEERFLRGVRKALNTPPTKHADEPSAGRKRGIKVGMPSCQPAARESICALSRVSYRQVEIRKSKGILPIESLYLRRWVFSLARGRDFVPHAQTVGEKEDEVLLHPD